jgi:D-alanyl-D-alanine carboxypeptidase (penicillin-binding protein 5/6)
MKFPRFILTTFITATIGFAAAQTPAPITAPAVDANASVAIPPAPTPVGTAWILMDYASGDVLAGENYDQPLEPASITKVMTSYVIAAEIKNGKIKPDDQVMMSERAWREGGAPSNGGSYSGFPLNQTAPLSEMEKGMVVQSGNDAAIALAEHVAGSEEAFASLMNSYAAKIGLKNSHFVNAHGLSAPGHVSTAHDLALLGRVLIRDFPETYALNKIKEFKVGNFDPQLNRNRLLWRDASVDGIKTGHHSAAGYCLMSSALRGDQRLIAVVMGSTSDAQRMDDSMALLNWGFRFYETHRLYDAGQAIATPHIWKGSERQVQLGVAQPLLVSVPRGRYNDLKPAMQLPKQLVAPIAQGQTVGTVTVTLDGKVIAQAPLVAVAAVERGNFFRRLWDAFLMWWES